MVVVDDGEDHTEHATSQGVSLSLKQFLFAVQFPLFCEICVLTCPLAAAETVSF